METFLRIKIYNILRRTILCKYPFPFNNYPPRNHLMKIEFYVERDFIQRWREKKREGVVRVNLWILKILPTQ